MYQFSDKTGNFDFWAQICPKMDFRVKILKMDLGSASPGAPIFRHDRQPSLFGSKLSQKWILGSEFQKSKSGFGINFQSKWKTFNFLA